MRHSTLPFIVVGLGIGGLVLSHDISPFVLVAVSVGILSIALSLVAFPHVVENLKHFIGQLEWWNGLWLLVFLSGLVFRVRDADIARESPLDLWGFYRILLMGIVGFLLFQKLTLKRPDWLPTLSSGLVGFLGAAAIWNLCSTIWSVYPSWTFYKSVEYFIDIVLLAAIVSVLRTPEQYRRFFNWTWLLLSFLAGTVLLGAFVWPTEAFHEEMGVLGVRLTGVFPMVSANNVGDLGAILGCVSLTRFIWEPDKRWQYSLVLCCTISLLIFSQTRSAFLGFLIASGCILVFSKKISPVALLGVVLVGGLVITALSQTLNDFFLRGQTEDAFLSGTGRLDWWGFAWEKFLEQPFSGFGAYAAGRFAVLQSAGFGATATLHNSWLEVLLGVGFFGVLLLGITCIGTWVNLLRTVVQLEDGVLTQRLAIEAIGVFSVLSIRSAFDSLIIWHPPLSFLAIVGFAEYLRCNLRNGSR